MAENIEEINLESGKAKKLKKVSGRLNKILV